MTKLATLLLALSATAAVAHPALVEHEHPHGVSSLLGLESVFVAAGAIVLALLVWRKVRS